MKYIKYLIAIVFIIPVFVLIYFLTAPIAYLLEKSGRKMASEKYKSAMIHFLVRWIMFFLGMRLIVEGRENLPPFMSGGAIFANHQSLLDSVVLVGSGVWCGFVGKAELKKIPVLNGFFKMIKSVYIDRKSPRDSIKAILDASNNIKKGHVMAIFPEGTRSKDGKIHEFKSGSFKMATRVKANVIPVAIYGSRAILEESRSLLFKKVYISYGKPIITKDMDEDVLKDVHLKVESEVRSLYEALSLKK